ncbi:uncharacterized protein LOC134783716 [Penaeus indicus]|uniref:uncharacterized protein LOC134783716 n=1 Tax=Penaeus indicus TaxID=29960 RepID=UPI00300D6A32
MVLVVLMKRTLKKLQFEGRVFSKNSNLLGIHKSRTSALHPQGQGMVEPSRGVFGRGTERYLFWGSCTVTRGEDAQTLFEDARTMTETKEYALLNWSWLAKTRRETLQSESLFFNRRKYPAAVVTPTLCPGQELLQCLLRGLRIWVLAEAPWPRAGNGYGPGVRGKQFGLSIAPQVQQVRQEKEQKTRHDEESDEEEELESASDFRDMRVNVSSLRLDAVLKAGLNMSRNKVESAFYDSKIRVNGQKVMKKSKQLQEEDEVDIIKAVSSKNPAFLDISRVVVLSIGSYNEDTDKIQVRLRKYPQLLVEKYEDDFETSS